MSDHKLKNSFPSPPPSQKEVNAFVDGAGSRDLSVVETFLDRHASAIDRKNDNGDTALMMAATDGQAGMARLLLKKGADIGAKNKIGWTPLMWAIFVQHTEMEIFEALLENKAALNAKDNFGWTPLMLASWLGYMDAVKLLLEKGASLEGVNNEGKTALMLAKEKVGNKVAALLEQRLQQQRKEREEQMTARIKKLKSQRPKQPPFKKNRP